MYVGWPFYTYSLPEKIEVMPGPGYVYWSFDNCCCSSEVMLGGFHTVVTAGEMDIVGCNWLTLDYAGYRKLLRMAVMLPVSILVLLVAHFAGHFAERFAEHFVGSSAEPADDFVATFGVAFDVAAIEECFGVARTPALVAGGLAAAIQLGCFAHFAVAEDLQTFHSAPRGLLPVVGLVVCFVEKV